MDFRLDAVGEGSGAIALDPRNFKGPVEDSTTWMPSAVSPVTPATAVTDEAAFARQLAAFEAEAWEWLFEREFPRVYRFAFVRTGEVSAAEDIAAEVFEEAAARIGRYEFRGLPVRAWLFRIARNLTADHLSRRKRRPVLRLEDAEEQPAPAHEDIESLTDVARAMAGLTPEQQEVLALRFISGCDLAETAASLGKSVGAVKLLQHRALQALRKRLGAGGERYR
jgi:RNA polymerase sigma-70 factor (ECF subfamily)